MTETEKRGVDWSLMPDPLREPATDDEINGFLRVVNLSPGYIHGALLARLRDEMRRADALQLKFANAADHIAVVERQRDALRAEVERLKDERQQMIQAFQLSMGLSKPEELELEPGRVLKASPPYRTPDFDLQVRNQELEAAVSCMGKEIDDLKTQLLHATDPDSQIKKEPALKPCPFCEDTTPHVTGSHESWLVECLECDATGPDVISRTDAIAAWNQRAGDA